MSDRINLLLVGLNFGKWVMENEILGGVGKEFVRVAAVCDLDAEKTRALAALWNARPELDLDAAVRREDIDAVLLITGPVSRAALVDRCLDAGKAVLTTKPFAPSAQDTLRVLARARRLGIPVYMNSPYPTMPPEIAQVRAWMRDYGLGRIVGYRASTYCSYREKPDGGWYDDPALCPAAPVYRLGIYMINDLCRLFSPVSEVNILQSRIFTERPTADNAQLGLKHADGSIGSVFCSFCVGDRQFYRNSLELNFENGTIYKNTGPASDAEREGIVMRLCAPRGERNEIVEACVARPPAGYPWREFHAAVRGRPPADTVTPEQVAAAIEVIEMMSAACGNGAL